MNSIRILQVTALLLAACTVEQENKPFAANKGAYNFFAGGKSQTTTTPQGNYFTLVSNSDSTFKISWGSNGLERTYNAAFDVLFAERISLEWENKDYLILNYWTGSNAWAEIVLPLNETEQVREIQNGRYFDEKQNLIVSEGFSGDTIFQVLNLKTGQQQPIIGQENPCEALPNRSGCADTVYINGNNICYTFSKQALRGGMKDVVRRQHLTIQ